MMTEGQVQLAIYWRRRSARLVMPNYTPAGWWECDMFVVMRSGYWHEFEIKLTATDLRADEQKVRQGRACFYTGRSPPKRWKYSQLAAGDPKGPSRFTYVVPQALAEEKFPDWAGIMHANQNENGKIYLEEVRRPPALHRHKVDQRVIEHARGVCYYRMWNERLRAETLADDRHKAAVERSQSDE